MFRLLEFITYLHQSHANLKNRYFCEIIKKAYVDRNPNGKYSITCDEYDRKYYNPYCCGVANIITSDLISKLYESTFHARYFWVDDAYVGFITDSLNVKLTEITQTIIKHRDRLHRVYENFLFITEVERVDAIRRNWEIIKQKNEKQLKQKIKFDKAFWKKLIKF